MLRSPRSASHLNIAQSSEAPSAAELGNALQHTSLQALQTHGSAALPPLLEGTTSISGPRTPRTPESMLHMQRSSTFGPSYVHSPSSPYFPSVPYPTPAFPRAVGDQARQIAENADSLAAQVEELVNTSKSFTQVWEYADAMRDECIRLRGLVSESMPGRGDTVDAFLASAARTADEHRAAAGAAPAHNDPHPHGLCRIDQLDASARPHDHVAHAPRPAAARRDEPGPAGGAQAARDGRRRAGACAPRPEPGDGAAGGRRGDGRELRVERAAGPSSCAPMTM
jgi:hypothetical protein